MLKLVLLPAIQVDKCSQTTQVFFSHAVLKNLHNQARLFKPCRTSSWVFLTGLPCYAAGAAAGAAAAAGAEVANLKSSFVYGEQRFALSVGQETAWHGK